MTKQLQSQRGWQLALTGSKSSPLHQDCYRDEGLLWGRTPSRALAGSITLHHSRRPWIPQWTHVDRYVWSAEPASFSTSVLWFYHQQKGSDRRRGPATQGFPTGRADPVGKDEYPENSEGSRTAHVSAPRHSGDKIYRRIDWAYQQHQWLQLRRSVPVHQPHWISSFCRFSCLKPFNAQDPN